MRKDFCAISVLKLWIMKWLFSFQAINCVEIKDQRFSYGAVCLKLTNHGSLG